MRYALIRELDVTNGEGVGISLFVQGCPFHCHGCFNQETWDFDGGQEWTKDIENKFFELINRPFIKRVTILGGEPLANNNVEEVYLLIKKIKEEFPKKNIWLYTGYTWESIFQDARLDMFSVNNIYRKEAIKMCDVVIDGQFDLNLQDINHKQIKFAGSTNQRVIDCNQTLKEGRIILHVS